jgi:hypothetical protein
MTDKARIKLAAVAVALFLAAVSSAGVLSQTRASATPVAGAVPSAVRGPSAPALVHSLNSEHDNNE